MGMPMNLYPSTDTAVDVTLRRYQVRACGAARELRITRRTASLDAEQSACTDSKGRAFAETSDGYNCFIEPYHTICGRSRGAGTRRSPL